ncbi:radical SAM family heme chaperone HemW [Buchnera aphidicola]|uniref:Heme chaperone HemW n=1 Tax=Buchnera aphidicola (Cinara strobi) TaxID=1921549 RepID=A0A3B1E1D4_9GAMM|nr:radical SAM family heme chaperone HemW [Buchnera aphidicola]VAX76865.1 Oxygen-independent coproporphyrinogen-III oxidase-like protein YggW [Buchnera aphidicola (Cinara strobi)]
MKKKKYNLPPLSLYIHIPWCIKKCPYCDFHSYKNSNKVSEKSYIKHLLKDLKNDKKLVLNRTIQSIFIGGGTPSLLKNSSIKYLLNQIKKILPVAKKAEISIEINPNSNQKNKLNQYLKDGINRLSIGIQTFHNHLLKTLQRTYKKKEIISLLNSIKKTSNRNLNLDLMYGLPGQSIQEALQDLYTTIYLKPEHISWYQLDIEPNTPFYSKNIILPSIKEIKKIQREGKKILKQAGYTQYEISAYSSKKKYQCLHNLNYWNFGDYLGIGCGAHGKITQKNKTIIRTVKIKNDMLYIKNKYIQKKYIVSNKDLPFEFFLNTFRLLKPIKYKNFEQSTNIKKEKIKKKILIAQTKGYLDITDKSWNITERGREQLNNLMSIFL